MAAPAEPADRLATQDDRGLEVDDCSQDVVGQTPTKPSMSNVEIEVDGEMQQVMRPFMSAMTKEFVQKWPHMEPELALLRFLCEKHSLEPPDVSLARKGRPKARGRRYEAAADGGSGAAETRGESKGGVQFSSGVLAPRPASPLVKREGQTPASESKDEVLALSAEVTLKPQMQTGASEKWKAEMEARDASRPASNLSFYKDKDSRPNSSLGKARPDSSATTRFAETPLQDFANDDVNMSRDEVDKLQFPDLAYLRNHGKTTEKSDHGHFMDFALPNPRIDHCKDTPYIVRHAACLRDKLDERREACHNALGKTGLKSLGHVQAMANKDFLDHEAKDSSKDVAGFAARIAKTRQGMRGEFISKVPLLSLEVVTPEEQFCLVGKCEPVNLSEGESVFNEGDSGHKLFILEGGTCIVSKVVKGEPKILCEVKPGDSFGDMAVMYDMDRSATVIAATSVKLLSLDREDIFSTVSPESLERMKAMTRLQLLASTPSLAGQSRENKALVLKHMRTDVFRAGREIMREGWRSGPSNRRVYIVESGTCSQERVTFPASSESLAPGTNFGNLEFALGCPQQTTVVATTEVSVISIGYDELKNVLGEAAESAVQVLRTAMHLKLLQDSHVKLKYQDDQTLRSVLDLGKFRHFHAWEPVVKKGDAVTHLMMLTEGICIEHDGAMDTLMEGTFESAQSTEHSRPGDSFEMWHSRDRHRSTCFDIREQEKSIARCTLVAINECSVFFVPMTVIKDLPDRYSSEG